MKRIGRIGRQIPSEGWHRRLSNQECPPKRRKSGRGPDSLMPIATRKALWRKFLADPSQWWDHRCCKRNDKQPDFVHSTTKEFLWVEGWSNPLWVKAKLAGLQGACSVRPSRASYCVPDMGSGQWSKLCDEGHLDEATDALDVLCLRGFPISPLVMLRLLKECFIRRQVAVGRRVHAFAVRNGHESNTLLGNQFLRMYAAYGTLEEAKQVFIKLPAPDVFGWSLIISAHCEKGQAEKAIELYTQMRESNVKADSYVAVAVLTACTTAGDIKSGQLVHADVTESGLESNQFVGSALVNMYSKCGKLDDARKIFDRLPMRNVVTWTAMISGYCQHGLAQDALHLYFRMQPEGVRPNNLTYLAALKACSSIGALQKGQLIHAQILGQGPEKDPFVGIALVTMYAQCGNLEGAREVFDSIPSRNVVTWTTMISCYTDHGFGQEALELYGRMQKDGVILDKVTLGSVLTACGSVGVQDTREAKELF